MCWGCSRKEGSHSGNDLWIVCKCCRCSKGMIIWVCMKALLFSQNFFAASVCFSAWPNCRHRFHQSTEHCTPTGHPAVWTVAVTPLGPRWQNSKLQKKGKRKLNFCQTFSGAHQTECHQHYHPKHRTTTTTTTTSARPLHVYLSIALPLTP